MPNTIRLVSLALVPLLLVCTISAQAAEGVVEAPSTVNATYVEPSATRQLKPTEKIGSLFNLNVQNDYVLQRLTERTYWFQKNYYATTFYVGDEGVLLFDPLDGAGQSLKDAIASVTNLPIRAIVYSHNHVDHIGSIKEFTKDSGKLRIIASAPTADQQAHTKSSHPPATDTVSWPNGSFTLEDLAEKVQPAEGFLVIPWSRCLPE